MQITMTTLNNSNMKIAMTTLNNNNMQITMTTLSNNNLANHNVSEEREQWPYKTKKYKEKSYKTIMNT
jgi:hypothetical protein